MEKNCLYCSTELNKKEAEATNKFLKRRFCSKKCSALYVHGGKKPWNFGKLGTRPWNKGIKGYFSHTNEWKLKQSERLKRQWSLGIRNTLHLKGERNPCWKGGKSSFRQSVRKIKEYVTWRTEVFKRDRFTCQDCGQIGGKLTVDHIVPLSYLLKVNELTSVEEARKCIDLWDLKNGKTLCRKCHTETPTWGGRAKNYKAIEKELCGT